MTIANDATELLPDPIPPINYQANDIKRNYSASSSYDIEYKPAY